MSKEILILSATYMNQEISGNNRTNYIPRLLSSCGHRVEMVCPNFNHHTKQHVRQAETDLPYEITLIPTTKYKNNVSLQRVISHKIYSYRLQHYLMSRRKPDVVYAIVPTLEVGTVARRYAKKTGAKLIIDVRDLWPEAFRMLFRVPVLSRALFYSQEHAANAIYKSADEIIAVSDTYKERAMQVNKRVIKAHTVYIGTELKMFDSAASQRSQRCNNKNGITIVYVGTLGNSYDLSTVFRSVNILRQKGFTNVSLLVMGSGPLESVFKSEANKLNIHVEFTGRLPYGEMVSRLVQCDIAVNPIRAGAAQSIINKHADYAAAGLPVISSQECVEYQSLLNEYRAGITCKPNNPEDMANKLSILIEDPELRSMMGQNHRRLAEEKFDRAKTYNAIVDLI